MLTTRNFNIEPLSILDNLTQENIQVRGQIYNWNNIHAITDEGIINHVARNMLPTRSSYNRRVEMSDSDVELILKGESQFKYLKRFLTLHKIVYNYFNSLIESNEFDSKMILFCDNSVYYLCKLQRVENLHDMVNMMTKLSTFLHKYSSSDISCLHYYNKLKRLISDTKSFISTKSNH